MGTSVTLSRWLTRRPDTPVGLALLPVFRSPRGHLGLMQRSSRAAVKVPPRRCRLGASSGCNGALASVSAVEESEGGIADLGSWCSLRVGDRPGLGTYTLRGTEAHGKLGAHSPGTPQLSDRLGVRGERKWGKA